MTIKVDFPLILKKLRHNDPEQTSIDLVSYYYSSDRIQKFAEALTDNTTLTSLSLCDVDIDNHNVTALAKALEKNSTLMTMELFLGPAYTRDHLVYEGITAIAKALEKNNSLSSIKLRLLMDTESVQAFAEMLVKNATLRTITLCLYRLSDENIDMLLRAVEKNSALTTISFEDATFSSENVQTLKRLIEKNSNLSSIKLYSWSTAEIDENEAVRILSTALESNTTLTSISLHSGGYMISKISALGLNALAKALEKNTTLTSFNCYDSHDKKEYFHQINAAINRNKKISALAHPALESLQRILALKECPNTEEEFNNIAKQYLNIKETLNEIKQLHPAASQLDQIQEIRIAIAAKHPWLIEPAVAFELFDELNETQKISDKNQSALETIALSYYPEITQNADYSHSKLLGFMLRNWNNSNKEQQIEHLLRQCLYRCINGKARQSDSLAIEPTVLLETLATNSHKLPSILQEIPCVNKIIDEIIQDAEKQDPVKSKAPAALVRNKIKAFDTELEKLFDLISKINDYSKKLDKKSSRIAKDKATALTTIVSACSHPHQLPHFNTILDAIHEQKEIIRQHRHWAIFDCCFPLFKSKLEKRVTSYKRVTDLEKHIEEMQSNSIRCDEVKNTAKL